MTAPPLVPVWQRPASFSRTLPRDWKRPEAITGAARKRPSRTRRAFGFIFGVALAVWIFFLINFMFTPQFWAIN